MDEAGTEYRRAIELTKIGRYEEALQGLGRLVGRAPDDARAWCQIAYVKFLMGSHEEALQDASRAVGLAPEAEWGHRLRSICLNKLRRYPEAVSAAAEAVSCAPDSLNAHSAVAAAAANARDFGRAEYHVRRMQSIDPGSHVTVLGAIQTSVRRRDWKTAEERCQHGKRLFPESADIWRWCGELALAQRRTADAISQFQEALRIDGNNEGAKASLVVALHTGPRSGRRATPRELRTWADQEFDRRLRQALSAWLRRLVARARTARTQTRK